MKPIKIIWHHSADSYNEHQFEKINASHKSRGFPISSLGFYVGYHWLIEPDGKIKQARKEDEIGAHDAGENLDSIGVCLAGNFNSGIPTKEQEVAAGLLVAQILTRWQLTPSQIYPHRSKDNTDCPGNLLGDSWLAMMYIKYELGFFAGLLERLFLRIK